MELGYTEERLGGIVATAKGKLYFRRPKRKWATLSYARITPALTGSIRPRQR
jgi:hypothetical protein